MDSSSSSSNGGWPITDTAAGGPSEFSAAFDGFPAIPGGVGGMSASGAFVPGAASVNHHDSGGGGGGISFLPSSSSSSIVGMMSSSSIGGGNDPNVSAAAPYGFGGGSGGGSVTPPEMLGALEGEVRGGNGGASNVSQTGGWHELDGAPAEGVQRSTKHLNGTTTTTTAHSQQQHDFSAEGVRSGGRDSLIGSRLASIGDETSDGVNRGNVNFLRKWEEQHEVELADQRDEETRKRTEIRRQAAEDLARWKSKREADIRDKSKNQRSAEERRKSSVMESDGVEWEVGSRSEKLFWTRVCNLVDFQNEKASGRDTSFLKSVLVSLKQEEAENSPSQG